MKLIQLISYWQRVRDNLLVTIEKFNEDDLAYVPFEGCWPVAELLLHIAHEEYGEINYGITAELDEWPAGYSIEDYPTIESIKALLKEVHDLTEAYLMTIDDADLEKYIEAPWGATFRQGDMLMHVLEH
ncbi:MAG: DinB family protein [Anaerolineaceae bacterium]|nr:DinB family protein [Anaerolineaceae bacterium]